MPYCAMLCHTVHCHIRANVVSCFALLCMLCHAVPCCVMLCLDIHTVLCCICCGMLWHALPEQQSLCMLHRLLYLFSQHGCCCRYCNNTADKHMKSHSCSLNMSLWVIFGDAIRHREQAQLLTRLSLLFHVDNMLQCTEWCAGI